MPLPDLDKERIQTFMKLRKDAGYSIQKVASALGRHRQTIANWEFGTTRIPPEAIPALKWAIIEAKLDANTRELLWPQAPRKVPRKPGKS